MDLHGPGRRIGRFTIIPDLCLVSAPDHLPFGASPSSRAYQFPFCATWQPLTNHPGIPVGDSSPWLSAIPPARQILLDHTWVHPGMDRPRLAQASMLLGVRLAGDSDQRRLRGAAGSGTARLNQAPASSRVQVVPHSRPGRQKRSRRTPGLAERSGRRPAAAPASRLAPPRSASDGRLLSLPCWKCSGF